MKDKKLDDTLSNVITGIVRIHQRGFGFVQPDHPSECPQDIFIPKHLTANAVDGDLVEALINPNPYSEKGPEGKIVAILKRGRTHLAGTICQVDKQGNLLAYVPILGSDKLALVESKEKLRIGDRVILHVLKWGEEEVACELSHHLGHISDPSIDTLAAVEEFDLKGSFPKTALAQARGYGSDVSRSDLKGRRDLTDLETFTIDPTTAKDFDDALSIEKDRKGHYQLGVHIADAAYYVPPGSPLDYEAAERSNSTYFPGTCLPMLPEELSTELCSLRPKVIRLTVSVLMQFDANGSLAAYEIVRSYIKSRKRFTYEEAREVLDGQKKSPHSQALKTMVELCGLLKAKRSERGSIDFSLPELVIRVDDKGVPIGTQKIEYDITHQLVEEFMLKANELVAKHLSDAGRPVLYRIHEAPSDETLQDFFTLAQGLGFSLPKEPTPQDLQELFEKAKSTPFAQQLSVAFIRSMKLAYYSEENVGHYGLALHHYCHFTSPIRRYSDMITQRLLFEEKSSATKENWLQKLEKIALKCSEQERISLRAETQVKALKKLRLLQQWLQEDPRRVYEAVVTRIKPFGLFLEVQELMLEAFLHISELENDYFTYQQNMLIGNRTHKKYFLGEKLKIQPISVNLILLESKWQLVLPKHQRRKR